MRKDEDECDLDEVSELLRTIQPSPEARLNNHRVVAAELERLQIKDAPVVWWKQSITLPVPVAMGLAALVCCVAVIPWVSRFQDPSSQPPFQVVTSQPVDIAAIDATSKAGLSLTTTTYLCGMGPIESETIRWHEE